jgi:pimeloyl-ACP methyl ester carboxylesterase
MSTRIRTATVLAMLTVTFTAMIATCAVPTRVQAAESSTMTQLPKPTKSGHIPANGVNYYYAVYGKGEPLLLLHGGLGQIEMFGPNLALLAQTREVIGVDLHGHGRTDLGNRAINLIDIGEDLAAIVKKLGYQKVDVMGYSFGGGAAFRLAAQHPELVRRLVVVSAGMAQDQFFPEMLPQQAAVGSAMFEQMKQTPMYQSYAAVAPHPEDFPKLLDRMGEYMRKPYDWSADVKKLTMPTMLVYGDSDMMRPEHIVKFYQLLGGGLKDAGWQREHMSQNRLAIIPNKTHYDIFIGTEVTETALPFLNGYPQPKSWADQVRGAK